MPTINTEIKMQGNDDAWFTANANVIFADNIQIFHNDGRYKFTDGITILSALVFRGAGSVSPTPSLSQVLAVGNSTGGVPIKSPNTDNDILIDNSGIYIRRAGNTAASAINCDDFETLIQHDALIELNAPSVKKNGIELITTNDILPKALTGLSITGSSISAADSILVAFGKLQNQIAGLIGGSVPMGVWNATTNTPTLVSSVGTTGHYYIVNVAGTTNLNGIIDWKVGDWAIFVNGVWNKIDNTDAVSSVNGEIGAVSLTTNIIPDFTNKRYVTDANIVALSNLATDLTAKLNTTNTTLLSYLEVPEQGVPATPTNALRLFCDALNRFGWIGENGFTRKFDGVGNTSDQMYTLQNKSGVLAHLDDITGSGNIPLLDAISQINIPPAHVAGERYVVGTAPTLAWVGQANNIAESNGTAWAFTVPTLNNTIFLTSTATTIKFNGTLWASGAATPILQNGNSLGVPLSVGTNDAHPFNVKTNNVIRLLINSVGNINIGVAAANPTPAMGLVRIGQGAGILDFGSSTTNLGTIWGGVATPSATNYMIQSNGTTTQIQAAGNVNILAGSVTRVSFATQFNFTPAAANGGAATTFLFRTPASATLTAGSEFHSFNFDMSTNTTQHASNTLIAINRDVVVNAMTHRFVTAGGVITDAVSWEVTSAPIAGTNATITRAWAARLLGNVAIGNRLYIGNATGVVAPTSLMHLAAGSATAGTSANKHSNGTRLTSPEAGVVNEFENNFYNTNNSLLRYGLGGTIFDFSADVTVGGAETDIFSTSLIANTFSVNRDKITAVYSGNFVTVGTEMTQLKCIFAGVTIWDSTGVAPVTGTTSWRVTVELMRKSATVVLYTVSLNTTGASGYVYCMSGELTGLTLTNANILKITGLSSGVGSGVGDIIGKQGSGDFKAAS